MLRVYFGHHKCASTWIWRILARVCRDAGLNHSLVLDRQTPSATGPLTDYKATFSRSELQTYIQSVEYDLISCITADQTQAEVLEDYRGIHVVRDPRDIVVSAYFSHRNSHPVDDLPHMATHRERLRSVSKEEGLFLEMEFSHRELIDLSTWDYDQSHILELKMEDVTAAPYDSFLEIFSFFELLKWDAPQRMRDKFRHILQVGTNRLSWRHPLFAPLRSPMSVTGEQVLSAVFDNRFEKKAGGRAHGTENKTSHYRKGVAGDWANHFTPDHVEAFKETFGEGLIAMDYEKDYDWSLPLEPSPA